MSKNFVKLLVSTEPSQRLASVWVKLCLNYGIQPDDIPRWNGNEDPNSPASLISSALHSRLFDLELDEDNPLHQPVRMALYFRALYESRSYVSHTTSDYAMNDSCELYVSWKVPVPLGHFKAVLASQNRKLLKAIIDAGQFDSDVSMEALLEFADGPVETVMVLNLFVNEALGVRFPAVLSTLIARYVGKSIEELTPDPSLIKIEFKANPRPAAVPLPVFIQASLHPLPQPFGATPPVALPFVMPQIPHYVIPQLTYVAIQPLVALKQRMQENGVEIAWDKEVTIRRWGFAYRTSFENHINQIQAVNPEKFNSICAANNKNELENALGIHTNRPSFFRSTTSTKLYDAQKEDESQSCCGLFG